jgi:hypothetical protein
MPEQTLSRRKLIMAIILIATYLLVCALKWGAVIDLTFVAWPILLLASFGFVLGCMTSIWTYRKNSDELWLNEPWVTVVLVTACTLIAVEFGIILLRYGKIYLGIDDVVAMTSWLPIHLFFAYPRHVIPTPAPPYACAAEASEPDEPQPSWADYDDYAEESQP